MSTCATDHQKGFEKNSAQSDMYREESPSHIGDMSRDHVGSQESYQSQKSESCMWSLKDMVQPKNPKHEPSVLKDLIENQAQKLITQKASVKQMEGFLKEIPWNKPTPKPSDRQQVVMMKGNDDQQPGAYVVFGMFVHGGVCGITKVTMEYPWLTRVLCHLVQLSRPGFQGTSIGVSCNCQAKAHRDKYNLSTSHNLVIPLVKPDVGGEIWVEGEASGPDEKEVSRDCDGVQVQGYVKPLKGPMEINPRKWHETMSWEGNRVLVLSYTLSSFYKLPRPKVSWLKRHGFKFPWKSSLQRGVQPSSPKRLKPESTSPAAPFEVLHAVDGNHQGGDATEADSDGRNTAPCVDQGAIGNPDCRVASCRGTAYDREGGLEDDQQSEDQAGPDGSLGRAQPRAQQAPDHGPTSGSDVALPHGGESPGDLRELHGVRKVQSPDVRASVDSLPELHRLDNHHRSDGEGMPLASSTLCTMGQRIEPHREGEDLPDGQQRDRVRDTENATEGIPLSPRQSGKLFGVERLAMGSRDHGDRPGPGDDPRDSIPGPSRPSGRARDRTPSSPRVGEEAGGGDCRAGPQAEQVERGLGQGPELSASEPAEADEEEPAPGMLWPLSFKQAKGISEGYERSMQEALKALGRSSVKMIEVGGSEESQLSKECEKVLGSGSVIRLSHWNGGDLSTKEGQDYVLKVIEESRPMCVWFSPDCVAYSKAQRLNSRSPEQVKRLQAKRDKADLEYEGVSRILRAVASQGITCVLALVEQCEAWNQPWMSKLQHDVSLYKGSCDGCQVNLRDYQGALICRSWGLLGTDGAMIQNLSLGCDQKHARGRGLGCEGLRPQNYTKEFGRRMARFLERLEGWFQVASEVQGPGDLCFAAEEAPGVRPSTDDPQSIQDIPAETRRKIFQNLRRIYTATGHCSTQYLVASLKKRGASKEVLRCAEQFSCDVCKERSRADPRSPATLNEIVPKWHTLQCDAFVLKFVPLPVHHLYAAVVN